MRASVFYVDFSSSLILRQNHFYQNETHSNESIRNHSLIQVYLLATISLIYQIYVIKNKPVEMIPEVIVEFSVTVYLYLLLLM